jgi:predicted secreted protein
MLVWVFLMAAATAAPATATEEAAPKTERMICKREPVTGSLARFRTICRTESKWRDVGAQAQDQARDMQDRGLINSESPR